jgi:hypothetical protein
MLLVATLPRTCCSRLPETLAQTIALVLEMLAIGAGLALFAFFRVFDIHIVFLPIYLWSYNHISK